MDGIRLIHDAVMLKIQHCHVNVGEPLNINVIHLVLWKRKTIVVGRALHSS